MLRIEEWTQRMELVRGDDGAFTVSKEPEGFAEGESLCFSLRRRVGAAELLLEKVVDRFDEGVALVEIAHEDTAELDFGSYVYDLQYRDAAGKRHTVVGPAEFRLKGEVSYD